MKYSWMLGLALALTGCMSTASIESAGPPPVNYRQTIAHHLLGSLFDPYSVQEAMLSLPRVHNSFSGPKWNVCFRGNAKNRLGGYTGVRETLFVIENERIIASASAYGTNACAGALYRPFLEFSQ